MEYELKHGDSSQTFRQWDFAKLRLLLCYPRACWSSNEARLVTGARRHAWKESDETRLTSRIRPFCYGKAQGVPLLYPSAILDFGM
jgi:hypothetical protein